MRELSEIEHMLNDIAKGNPLAFSELYDCTSAKLYAICLRVFRFP